MTKVIVILNKLVAYGFQILYFYKPYNVLNQFTKERPEHITLAEFLNVEKDVYPVGRLDKDSEGLLILTNDTSVNEQLLHPRKNHKRTYIVQLENDISSQAIQILTAGTNIKLDSGLYKTQPCHVKKLPKTPVLPERNPPVRFRQNIPTSWALITLTEGKNRQVRKMFASVGFPVLRLVRVQIENLKLGKLEPGKFMSISSEELFEQLNITVQPKKMPPKAPVNAKKSTSNVNEEGTRYTPKSTFKSFRERNKRTRK